MYNHSWHHDRIHIFLILSQKNVSLKFSLKQTAWEAKTHKLVMRCHLMQWASNDVGSMLLDAERLVFYINLYHKKTRCPYITGNPRSHTHLQASVDKQAAPLLAQPFWLFSFLMVKKRSVSSNVQKWGAKVAKGEMFFVATQYRLFTS